MQRAAEIAALVFTARDAMLQDRAEYLRVAFLLFDSAAETLMVRAIGGGLPWEFFDRNRLRWAREDSFMKVDLNDLGQRDREEPDHKKPLDLNDPHWLDSRINWYLTPTQRQSINRNFDDKLRFLAWNGTIPNDLVGVTSRLHEYRNEMYHREETRPGALRISAHLYALVVTQLLELLPPNWIALSGPSNELVDSIFSRLTDPAEGKANVSWLDFGGVQNALAEDLRSSLDLEDARDVIGSYIRDRVAETHESLGFVGDYMSEFDHSVTRMTELDVVRHIYIWEFGESIADLRSRRAPVTSAMIARWDSWAETIPAEDSPLEVFASLTQFEGEFEPFESKVREAASSVDQAIQNEIDRARGK